MKLRNQVALITGSSQGLGLAIARRLSAEGAAVSLVARAGDKLDQAARELAGSGGRAIAAAAERFPRKSAPPAGEPGRSGPSAGS